MGVLVDTEFINLVNKSIALITLIFINNRKKVLSMKAVILAGGLGSRLAEETDLKPKPMVEIGGRPIIWHIMKMYSYHGINDFIICCGYKSGYIKNYFLNYKTINSNFSISLASGDINILDAHSENWNVTLIDTGIDSMTGGRLKRLTTYLKNEDLFCLTYGDGVGDIDITKSISFHKQHKKLATLTAVFPIARFGALDIEKNQVKTFSEKPKGDGQRISAGFFVLSPKVLDYISDDTTIWEKEPLEKLALQNELMAFNHDGFWQPMDTLRDQKLLNELCNSGAAPWQKWD